MILVKLHSSILAEARKKYDTLRMYTSGFEFEGDYVISKAYKKTNGKIRPELYDALFDWQFNEEEVLVGDNEDGSLAFEFGDAHFFYEEHPKGFEFKVISVVNL